MPVVTHISTHLSALHGARRRDTKGPGYVAGRIKGVLKGPELILCTDQAK